MNSQDQKERPAPPPAGAAARKAREAEALRRNLVRRKQQARARAEPATRDPKPQ